VYVLKHFLLFALKTILCIDDKQGVPFRSNRSMEPAGYIVFIVWDAAMATKVEELFAIDFRFPQQKDSSLPIEIDRIALANRLSPFEV
jgi:hypothetical protein